MKNILLSVTAFVVLATSGIVMVHAVEHDLDLQEKQGVCIAENIRTGIERKDIIVLKTPTVDGHYCDVRLINKEK